MKTLKIDSTLRILFAITAVSIVFCIFGLSILFSKEQAPLPEQSPVETDARSPIPMGPALSAKENPWGAFLPGSWRRLQVVTWTVHEGKRIRNVTEMKTTLKSIEEDGVTLEETTRVNLADKQIETAPQIKRYDFFQCPIDEGIRVSPDFSEKLMIDHQIVPCEKRIYEQKTASGKRKATLWYSSQISPYVFRVERIHRSIPTDKDPEERVLSSSVTEVLESSAFRLRTSKNGTYRLQKIRKSGTMTTVTETFCSRYVPGGVLRETTRELDQDGREIRTVETRLINYHYTSSMVFPAVDTMGNPKKKR